MGSFRADCQYCTRDQRLQEVLLEVCRLDVSTLYLCREQTYRGRAVVALNAHETELFTLDDDALCRFTREVTRAARAIRDVTRADKINYAIYGDLVSHLHYHLAPKHRGGPGWGQPFTLQPDPPRHLSAEDFGRLADAIRADLG